MAQVFFSHRDGCDIAGNGSGAARLEQTLVVLKFGSSVLSNDSQLPVAVHEVYRAYRQGRGVIAVVSAIGSQTNALLDRAEVIASPASADEAMALLLATGETQSAALLTMALCRAGLPATCLDAASMDLMIENERLDGDFVGVDDALIRNALKKTPVIVVPGFAARHRDGGVGLTGRGGSDLSAVYLAHALRADECRLLKDVDGIYECDPAVGSGDDQEESPHRYGHVSYEDALRVSSVLVQPKATEFLRETRGSAQVAAMLHQSGTTIGNGETYVRDAPCVAPMKVLMLGFGKIGQCVYSALQRMPQAFDVVGIGVKDINKSRPVSPPVARLSDDIDALLREPYDVLVELTGDTVFAERVTRHSLNKRATVVTADRTLLSLRQAALRALAGRRHARFVHSAAVGGAAPLLEAVQRVAAHSGIRRLRAVLATEFDRDASAAAEQLRVLAFEAFGAIPLSIDVRGIDTAGTALLDAARGNSGQVHQVVDIDADGNGSVAPQLLSLTSYLGGGNNHECRLEIVDLFGVTHQVSGVGTGCWPTAEAVIADLVECYIETRSSALDATCTASVVPPFFDREFSRRPH